MSKIIEVKAKLGKEEGGAACAVNWDAGNSVEEKVEMFGETVVDQAAEGQFKVQLQAGLRRCLEAGKDPQAYADAYKPGVRAPSIAADPYAAAVSAFSQMSPDEKAKYLQEIKESIAAAG